MLYFFKVFAMRETLLAAVDNTRLGSLPSFSDSMADWMDGIKTGSTPAFLQNTLMSPLHSINNCSICSNFEVFMFAVDFDAACVVPVCC